MRTKAFVAVACAIGAVTTGAIVVASGTAGASAPYGSWSPGGDRSVRALERPAESKAAIPAAVVEHATFAAARTGGDPELAARSLRTLRVGAGAAREAVYAFSPADSATCLIVGSRSVACPTNHNVDHAGVLWVVSGGMPATTNSAAIPTSLVGVVADNVVAVRVVSNGETVDAPVVNNAFYYDLVEPASGEPWTIELRVSYADGTVKVVPIVDPRG